MTEDSVDQLMTGFLFLGAFEMQWKCGGRLLVKQLKLVIKDLLPEIRQLS